MTATMRATAPAVLGGEPAFADGLPLVRPTIEDPTAVLRRFESIVDSGMLTNGPTVRELEELAAARLGVPHVVAVASCTSGLMLTLQAVGARGPVVMPSFTFAASAHAVVWAGGSPVFAEVDPESATLDPDDAARCLDGAVAMTATHVYGTPCDTDRLQAIADAAGIPLVYDAAHALGSRRRGVPVGGFGTAEVFSLSPTKVTVAGEGGLVSTHDGGLAERLRYGRDYGNPGDYDCLFPGLNARMSELHAALAIVSLARLDTRIARRNELVAAFRAATLGLPGLRFPRLDDEDVSTYKDLTLIVDPDEFGLSVPELRTALRAEGVDTRRYYHPPIHRQQAYRDLPVHRPLPVTDRLAERVLTVPLWSHMTDEQVAALAGAVVRIGTNAPAVARQLRSVAHDAAERA
jgi:dTDP-4-amino-4,6-dideoxygalactose transaminase